MGKKAAIAINFSVNSVAIEDELTSIEQTFTQESIKVDGLSSSGPERVVGNYDYGYSLDGNFDGAASQGDATIFAMVGNSGRATTMQPTGAAAGADDPNYTGTVVLADYSIKGSVGSAVSYSAKMEGNGAMARAVA